MSSSSRPASPPVPGPRDDLLSDPPISLPSWTSANFASDNIIPPPSVVLAESNPDILLTNQNEDIEDDVLNEPRGPSLSGKMISVHMEKLIWQSLLILLFYVSHGLSDIVWTFDKLTFAVIKVNILSF